MTDEALVALDVLIDGAAGGEELVWALAILGPLWSLYPPDGRGMFRQHPPFSISWSYWSPRSRSGSWAASWYSSDTVANKCQLWSASSCDFDSY